MNIAFDGQFNYDIQNLLGQTVYSGSAVNNEKIDLSNVENGVYLIHVFDGNSEFTIKLIKQ